MDTLNDISLLYESSILNQNIDYYILENKYNELININEVKVDTRWQKIKNGIIRVLTKIINGFKFIFNKISKILGLLPRAIKFITNTLNHIRKAKYRDGKKEIVCCDIDKLTKSLDKCYKIYNDKIADTGDFFLHLDNIDTDLSNEKYQQIEDSISYFNHGKNNVFPQVKKEIEENKKVVKKYTYEELTKEYFNFAKELNGESYKNYRRDTARLKHQIEISQLNLKDAKKSYNTAENKEEKETPYYKFYKKYIEYFTVQLDYQKMYLSLVTSTEVFIMKQFKKFISRFDMEDLEFDGDDYDDFDDLIQYYILDVDDTHEYVSKRTAKKIEDKLGFIPYDTGSGDD